MSRHATRAGVRIAALTAVALTTATLAVAAPAASLATDDHQPDQQQGHGRDHDRGQRGELPKVPFMTGSGGAVSSVDRDASQIGIDVLARGGNAADAAVATAAALGVVEPYSAGIGGGGFLVYYDARSHKVTTIDGRETAPGSFTEKTFTNDDGSPMTFSTVVSSGLSVGVPGTPALWDKAARTFGTMRLSELLQPAERLATTGFTVDQTFHDQTAQNASRFSKFPETARVFLPGGQPPQVGTTFRNPDLARAYRELRTKGVDSVYSGRLAAAIVDEARQPHTAPGVSVPAGELTGRDLAAYRALLKEPIHSEYRGYDVYGMPVPSSGGIAVAEILNLIRAYESRTGSRLESLSNADYLHWFSEASATAFADRNRYVGDVPGVPVKELTSDAFAAERACTFSPTTAQSRPIPFGNPDGSYQSCDAAGGMQPEPYEGQSTTHLVAADRWGNVASYTLTIEQTGGSGITVPGYGFLLNNELTDFNFVPLSADAPDPNLPGPAKRPRSSMSPTILLRDGHPVLAVGSPGGATIITTVSQTILGYLDRNLSLLEAIAAARLSSRNGNEAAEPPILNGSDGAALTAMGHHLVSAGTPPEIGAVTAIHPRGRDGFDAAAEPSRRGGGSAMVVRPDR